MVRFNLISFLPQFRVPRLCVLVGYRQAVDNYNCRVMNANIFLSF